MTSLRKMDSRVRATSLVMIVWMRIFCVVVKLGKYLYSILEYP